MTDNVLGARYTLCTTYDAATSAAELLSTSSTLILYCQGRDLGLPDGELSIIALSNSAASEVFLFDVLALRDKYNSALAPLFSLLQRPDITKLVWDGRTYLLEIADTYGVLLQGVLDLQLAEVSRRGKKESNPHVQHTLRYFKRVADVLDKGFTFPDIHKLMGIRQCVGLLQLPGSSYTAFSATALRKQHGSAMWLLRPIPDELRRRCAHDVELISQLYTRLLISKKFVQQLEELQSMTVRYMEVYPTRELRALHVPLDLYKFLPLEVLEASPTNCRRYKCGRCERMLTPASFLQPLVSNDADATDEALQSFTMCRLCRLLALRNNESKADAAPSLGQASKASSSYMLISTYEQAETAAEALARYTTLILDCEGQDFGGPNGVLSVLSIGSYPASDTVYLFDVLALADKHNPLLAPLLFLLGDPCINKLVWDGRGDFLELALAYSITLKGVVDIQLAEIMQRPTYLNTYTLAYFNKSEAVMRDIGRNPLLLEGIHRLMGLDNCAAVLCVADGIGGKDPAVTDLHRTTGGSTWLHRPLPAMLLQYAAHDIQLISRVAEVLLPRVHIEQLREASARYMRVYPTREAKQAHIPLDLNKFLPLDVIDPPSLDGSRYPCARCERMLSLACFPTRTVPVEQAADASVLGQIHGYSVQHWRWTMCRLCVLLAFRNSEEQMASWRWTMLP